MKSKNAEFQCARCGTTEVEELWAFGEFGDYPQKIIDRSYYCKKCFDILDKQYEEEE